jgi:hypothetical protein
MHLVRLGLSADEISLPRAVRAFLREADRRIERFRRDHHFPGFVPSDYAKAYAALRTLAAGDLAPGRLFCEWGSGFGVVACLAAMLDFEASGIEIEEDLVDAARQLAEDFDLPVEFACGSFLPAQGDACLDSGDGFAWLTTHEGRAHEELGLAPADFDVIFAYPWPDEERLIRTLFERHAGVGAKLLTYHGGDDFQLWLKTG